MGSATPPPAAAQQQGGRRRRSLSGTSAPGVLPPPAPDGPSSRSETSPSEESESPSPPKGLPAAPELDSSTSKEVAASANKPTDPITTDLRTTSDGSASDSAPLPLSPAKVLNGTSELPPTPKPGNEPISSSQASPPPTSPQIQPAASGQTKPITISTSTAPSDQRSAASPEPLSAASFSSAARSFLSSSPFFSNGSSRLGSTDGAGSATPGTISSSLASNDAKFGSQFDVDDMIQRLLEVRKKRSARTVCLKPAEITYVCQRSKEIFLDQPMLLELNAPVNIVIFTDNTRIYFG
ncbi:hypothetical protein HK405_011003, partial [Cladochytrium tenue]